MFDLKKFRKDFDLKQSDLQEILEIPQSFISKIENGKESLPKTHYRKLADKYGDEVISRYEVQENNISFNEPFIKIDIYSLRESLNMNQTEFAINIGIGQSYLSELEREVKPITNEIYTSIIEKYGEEFVSDFIVEDMSVKERIKAFVKYMGISIREFEKLSGLNYGYVNSIRVSIQPDKLKGIASHFVDLNTSWLITGEGEMLKSGKPLKHEVVPVPESEYMMVEYVDLRASAGKLGGADVEQLPETHRRLVPKDYAKGGFLVVRVDGDSMDDGTKRSLSDGDEVLVYQHEGSILDSLPIRKTLFVITTREGNVLKQITEINKEEKYITCHSFNTQYQDFKIDFADIYQIFIVCKVTQKQISLI